MTSSEIFRPIKPTKEGSLKSLQFCPCCCPELDPTPEKRKNFRFFVDEEMCRECVEGWKPIEPSDDDDPQLKEDWDDWRDWTPWTPPDGWENHNVIGKQSFQDSGEVEEDEKNME